MLLKKVHASFLLHTAVFSLLQTQAEVRKLLSFRGVRVETREFDSSRGPGAIKDVFVKERDMRVFVLNMYPLFAGQVLCQVSRCLVPTPLEEARVRD